MAQKLLTNPILKALAKTPYGTTDGVERDSKKVIARYFGGAAFVCYVLEDDHFFKEYKEGKNDRMVPTSTDEANISDLKNVFAAQSVGHGLELGCTSLKEVFSLRFRPFGLGVERDTSVEPFKYTLGELRKMHGEDWL